MKKVYMIIAISLLIGCGGGNSSSKSESNSLDENSSVVVDSEPIEHNTTNTDIDEGEINNTAVTLPPAESLSLYQQAKEESLPHQYQFAIDQGATFHTTTDGKSFYLEWYPEGVSAESKPPMIVSISGHAGWVFAEFFHWQSHVKERGYGFIALQWWFGTGESIDDYYLPKDMYPIFETILRDRGVEAGRVLFHGFSRGSANSYGVTLYDRLSGNNFFGLTVANSGKADSSFSPNDLIEAGEFGEKPLADTHWVTVCGMQDIDPNHTCESISQTNEWITRYGGSVDLFIEDEGGGHEAFYTNPNNIDASLDIFAGLLEE